MNSTGKAVAWICVFSTLFMGCYSSAMIDPRGDERDKIYTDKIEFVVMNDGTKYDFDPPPSLINNTIVGANPNQPVSIPLSNVSTISTGDDRDKMNTGRISFLITKDGRRYAFDTPPIMSNNSYVGVARGKSVSIPLSDVSKVYVTKANPVGTVFLVLGAAALIVGVVFLAEGAETFHKVNEAIESIH